MAHRCTYRVALLAMSACVTGVGIAQEEPAAPKRTGRMITLQGVIDTGQYNRVMNATRTALRQGVETIVYNLESSPSDFGPCFELASFLSELSGARTVAYVSGQLTGHAVLVALACDEIVLASNAKIGDVYHDRPPRRLQREQQDYVRIAREQGHGSWIAMGMLDANLRLLQIETAAGGKRLVPADQLDEISKREKVLGKPVVVKEAGERLLLGAEQAKRVGLIRLTADSRAELAAFYGLPEAIAADTPLDAVRKPVLLRLSGNIDNSVYGYVQRRLKQAVSRGHDLLIVEIDSTHGSESATQSIANAISSWTGHSVAWVPRQATGAAMLILFGCDELVVASQATIGGYEPEDPAPEYAQALADASVALADGSRYPLALVRRLVDPGATVFEVRNTKNHALRSFKTAQELEDPQIQELWEKTRPGPLRNQGTVLQLTGKEALSLDLAVGQAETLDELRSLYDAPPQIYVLEPGWIDALVDALTSGGGTVFLLTLGFLLAYLELQMAGFGVAGLLSATCFVLFFWSRFLAGTRHFTGNRHVPAGNALRRDGDLRVSRLRHPRAIGWLPRFWLADPG